MGTRNTVYADIVSGVGPLRLSPTFLVVLDRMVETVFLALMGTTMGWCSRCRWRFSAPRISRRTSPAGGSSTG